MSKLLYKAGVEAVLARVAFAPSCVDMAWRWEVSEIGLGTHPDARGYAIRTTFQRPDRDTGKLARGFGRWWHVPYEVTESGVVKTAFAAAKMILEHELMESFRYEEVRLFDPHHEVTDLRAAAGRASERDGREDEAFRKGYDAAVNAISGAARLAMPQSGEERNG